MTNGQGPSYEDYIAMGEAIIAAQAAAAAAAAAAPPPPPTPPPTPPPAGPPEPPPPPEGSWFWELIKPFIQWFLDAATKAWNWVNNAFGNVWDIVEIWWSVTSSTLVDWISAATKAGVSTALNAWNWVKNAFWNVWDIVDIWWSVTKPIVQSLIDTAVGGLKDVAGAWSDFWNNLWPALTRGFDSLKSSWDNFWVYTLPDLVTNNWLTTWWIGRLLDVRALINTAVKDIADLAEGWQEMKSNVVTFFQDPLEFIWQRFADWFLGPEG